jgi:hypothetical protein
VSGIGGNIRTYMTEFKLFLGRGRNRIDLGNVEAKVIEGGDATAPVLFGRKPIFDRFKVVFEEYI